jgi:hypothetical protein
MTLGSIMSANRFLNPAVRKQIEEASLDGAPGRRDREGVRDL